MLYKKNIVNFHNEETGLKNQKCYFTVDNATNCITLLAKNHQFCERTKISQVEKKSKKQTCNLKFG